MRVDVVAYDPAWVELAERESQRWRDALGDALHAVHHIGSTAVPRLSAKPVIDLLPVISQAVEIDSIRERIHGMGYEWLGEHGLPRRRYCRRSCPTTGRRLVQAHCWTEGDSEIDRHLAFRDLLRSDPMLMGAYEGRKRHCASLHLNDPAAYCACKSGWIDTAEARALKVLGGEAP